MDRRIRVIEDVYDPPYEHHGGIQRSCHVRHSDTRRLVLLSIAGDKTAVQAQPLIAVRNVRASSRWYCRLLGADSQPEHPHRDFYDRISHGGRLLLQLHAWDAEDHPNIVNPTSGPVGHGVLLWFQVDDFDALLTRAEELSAEVIQGPQVNPAPQHRELWLRDLDGFVVVIASPDGECCS